MITKIMKTGIENHINKITIRSSGTTHTFFKSNGGIEITKDYPRFSNIVRKFVDVGPEMFALRDIWASVNESSQGRTMRRLAVDPTMNKLEVTEKNLNI
ncbi:hypothetical protein V6N13_022832 [Hibiscus sabdariffa]